MKQRTSASKGKQASFRPPLKPLESWIESNIDVKSVQHDKKATSPSPSQSGIPGKSKFPITHTSNQVQLIESHLLPKFAEKKHDFKVIGQKFDHKQWEIWKNGVGLIHKSGAIIYGDKSTLSHFFLLNNIKDNFIQIRSNIIEAVLKKSDQIINFENLFFQKRFIQIALECLTSPTFVSINRTHELAIVHDLEFGCLICPYFP